VYAIDYYTNVYGLVEIVKFFHSIGCSDTYGYGILNSAVLVGDLDVVKFLCEIVQDWWDPYILKKIKDNPAKKEIYDYLKLKYNY
jgi:hypothetical protein